MITFGWLVFVAVLFFLFLAIRIHPETGNGIDARIKSLVIIMFTFLGVLALVYGVVRFVR